jgi:hypothetical protein
MVSQAAVTGSVSRLTRESAFVREHLRVAASEGCVAARSGVVIPAPPVFWIFGVRAVVWIRGSKRFGFFFFSLSPRARSPSFPTPHPLSSTGRGGGGGRGRGGRGRGRGRDDGDGFEETVVQVQRVTKVTKGGSNMSFRATVGLCTLNQVDP